MTHTRAHLTPDFDEYLLLDGWSVYAQPDAQLSWLRVAEACTQGFLQTVMGVNARRTASEKAGTNQQL